MARFWASLIVGTDGLWVFVCSGLGSVRRLLRLRRLLAGLGSVATITGVRLRAGRCRGGFFRIFGFRIGPGSFVGLLDDPWLSSCRRNCYPAMSLRSDNSSRQVIPILVKLLNARAMALVLAILKRCRGDFGTAILRVGITNVCEGVTGF